jgi:DNA-binding beta-propeller fold protein YncE
MYGKHCIHKTFLILALGLVLLGTSGTAWAQLKVYARVEPNQDDTVDPLVVDVNQSPNDNVTPNIVIASDQKRGFVAYTGSGVVLEFSLETGEVLNRIETEGMPLYGTVLPDQRTLLVVSAWDSRIFVIDMDSEPTRQVATYTFANAQFGFGSMITLSPDGTLGYVSSTGSSEVIKFDAATGQEIGRFKSDMRLPAQVTVTPDGATLIVVDTDVGKPEVDFFDTQTYAKKSSLTNPDPTLYYVAFTIANKAVLAPDGKTGIIASRGQNSVLYSEVVFQFDATTGKILKTGNTGSGPGYTTVTPDGKLFVIMNMFSLTVIPTDDFDLLTEFQAAAGDAIVSSNIVITPDSKNAYYAASGSDQILQIDRRYR